MLKDDVAGSTPHALQKNDNIAEGAGSAPCVVHKNNNVAEGAHLEDRSGVIAEGEFSMGDHILQYAWMTEDPTAP